MAIISCPECDRDISDKAQACPGCGAPVQAQRPTRQKQESQKVMRAGAKFEGLGFVAIVFGMIVAMAGSGTANTMGVALIVGGVIAFLIGRFM